MAVRMLKGRSFLGVNHGCRSRFSLAIAKPPKEGSGMRNLVKSLLILGLISLLPIAVFGQLTSGDLVGTVRDSSGAVVSDASVVATHIATGIKTNNKTNATGEFHFVNLPTGRYTIDVTSAGLKGGTEVIVNLNQT